MQVAAAAAAATLFSQFLLYCGVGDAAGEKKFSTEGIFAFGIRWLRRGKFRNQKAQPPSQPYG